MNTKDAVVRILAQLDEVRLRCPDLRFGQLIATIAMLAEDETGHSIWDVEDNDFAAALARFSSDMARRDAVLPPDNVTPANGAEASQPVHH